MLRATVRMPDDVEKEYRELAGLYGVSGNELILNLIRAEYSKVEEDPKVKLAFEQMRKLKATFEEFSAELDKAGFPK